MQKSCLFNKLEAGKTEKVWIKQLLVKAEARAAGGLCIVFTCGWVGVDA